MGDVGERSTDHERSTRVRRHEHSVGFAVVGEPVESCSRYGVGVLDFGDLEVLFTDGQNRPGDTRYLAGPWLKYLDTGICSQERVDGSELDTEREVRIDREVGNAQSLFGFTRSCEQELVDLVVQLALGRDVGQKARAEQHDGYDAADNERDSPTQAHVRLVRCIPHLVRCGSIVEGRRPRFCGVGSRCRRRVTSSWFRSRSPRFARR